MELVGNYKNAGQQWCPKGDAIEVLTRDFPDPEVPKAVPDSVYDVGQSIGSVNAGMISDTAELAVESIRQWWRNMGRPRYSRTCRLLICADSKGSNGHCFQLWKREPRAFPRDGAGRDHYGVSLSAWHEQVEQNRASTVLFYHDELEGSTVDRHHTIVDLITGTKTQAGLTVKARLDRKVYKRGIKVSAQERKTLEPELHPFHGEWNYTIKIQRRLA